MNWPEIREFWGLLPTCSELSVRRGRNSLVLLVLSLCKVRTRGGNARIRVWALFEAVFKEAARKGRTHGGFQALKETRALQEPAVTSWSCSRA